ncbi:MAG: hypothetical protein ACRDND_26235, partial [Streptosporangiaceae bacterium]
MKIIEGRVRIAASDVANFLACQQLTQLDLQAAHRTLRTVLDRFRADGHEVTDPTAAADPAGATAAAFYSHLLAGLQGTEPRWMHMALGRGELVPFKVSDFAAYERQTRRRLGQVLAGGQRDDGLSRVAGITTSLEDGMAAADAARQAVVAGYNEDDCRATLALRDWLEDRHRDLAERAGQQLPRPFVVEATRALEDPEGTRSGPRCWPAF